MFLTAIQQEVTLDVSKNACELLGMNIETCIVREDLWWSGRRCNNTGINGGEKKHHTMSNCKEEVI